MSTQIIINKGWTAFCSASDKKVFGYTEFKNGGKYFGKLELVSADTKAALFAKLAELGYPEPK